MQNSTTWCGSQTYSIAQQSDASIAIGMLSVWIPSRPTNPSTRAYYSSAVTCSSTVTQQDTGSKVTAKEPNLMQSRAVQALESVNVTCKPCTREAATMYPSQEHTNITYAAVQQCLPYMMYNAAALTVLAATAPVLPPA
jgi:hypothetical protein